MWTCKTKEHALSNIHSKKEELPYKGQSKTYLLIIQMPFLSKPSHFPFWSLPNSINWYYFMKHIQCGTYSWQEREILSCYELILLNITSASQVWQTLRLEKCQKFMPFFGIAGFKIWKLAMILMQAFGFQNQIVWISFSPILWFSCNLLASMQ